MLAAETEASLMKGIFGGEPSAPPAVSSATGSGEPAPKYEFDEAFQSKIAAMVLRSTEFNQFTEGLIKPDYFQNVAEGTLVHIVLEYFTKYRRAPDPAVLKHELQTRIADKRIRKDLVPEIKDAFKRLMLTDISDQAYVVDVVSEFARHQAFSAALLESVELVEKRRFDKAFELIRKAMDVGKHDDIATYDYFERIEARTKLRKEMESGLVKARGITTGNSKLDQLLYHRGWGRKELTVLMGAAKVGKSTALASFAKNAVFDGKNVLLTTLEVSQDIYAERLDANVAGVPMNELGSRIMEVDRIVKSYRGKTGKFLMHEFPPGVMTPAMLRRLLLRYKQRGIVFDMVVVDYADLMAPDIRYDNPIENSKNVYIGLRALAHEFDLAMLTATQTNRDGVRAAEAKMEHVAEDFNRVRIADLVISINRTEDDKRNNEARLYFAASRNQRGDIRVVLKQDVDKMIFISDVVRVE